MTARLRNGTRLCKFKPDSYSAVISFFFRTYIPSPPFMFILLFIMVTTLFWRKDSLFSSNFSNIKILVSEKNQNYLFVITKRCGLFEILRNNKHVILHKLCWELLFYIANYIRENASKVVIITLLTKVNNCDNLNEIHQVFWQKVSYCYCWIISIVSIYICMDF